MTTLTLNKMAVFAKRLAALLTPKDVILLHGDLGAGKTQLAKFIIRAMTRQDTDVPSPTFTLVQTYDSPQGEIWHFDLYRLEDADEIEATGWDEARAYGISLVEWPDRLGPLRPKTCLDINIEIAENDTRDIILTPHCVTWEDRLNHLQSEHH